MDHEKYGRLHRLFARIAFRASFAAFFVIVVLCVIDALAGNLPDSLNDRLCGATAIVLGASLAAGWIFTGIASHHEGGAD